jgi:hypothetical protein
MEKDATVLVIRDIQLLEPKLKTGNVLTWILAVALCPHQMH